MKSLIATAAVLALTIGSAAAAPKPKPGKTPFEEPLVVTMNVGDPDRVIATSGTLQAIAKCVAAGDQSSLQLLIRSALDGWATTFAGIDLPAGDAVFGAVTNASPEFASGAGVGFIALGPDGSFLAFGRDTLAAGVNVFGWDCVAVGVTTHFKGDLEP